MNKNTSLPMAIANIQGGNNFPELTGQVKFYQKRNAVLVVANIRGLPETLTSFFGFHIHEGNSCGGNIFSETGSHYNPTDTHHPYHAGDLPPLMRCNSGAYLAVATDRFNVKDIIGRTVVIHSMPDDFTTQPAGNAGMKIGCGIITHYTPKKNNHT